MKTTTFGTRLGAVALCFALVGVTVGGSHPAAAAPAACASSADIAAATDDAEAVLLARLNDLRVSRGLATLTANGAVASQSAGWSWIMSGQNWLHHANDTGPNDGVEPDQDYVRLISQVVPKWTRVAENVGYRSFSAGCSAAELRAAVRSAASQLHDTLAASSTHYANMVGDFNQVGVGVHVDASRVWATVRFVKGPLPNSSAASRYIQALVDLFLSRSATSSDISRWSGAIQMGDRASVTMALATSDEWAGVRVRDLYRKVLGRTPDNAGRLYWVDQIRRGMRLEDVAIGLYASPEYFARNGKSNRGFVTGLYRDILHRNPDGPGLAHWTSILDRGVIDRTTAAASFYASIESRNDRVTTLYSEVLGRSPDGGGLRYWADQLLNTGDVMLASFLASSQEFYTRATR